MDIVLYSKSDHSMKVFHTIKEVVEWRNSEVGDRRTVSIGFVPTMGCLHDGHASLINKSVEENNFTVVSVFVNPSQFAPNEDLDKYPRTLKADITLLESLNVDVLFAPNANEMYPQGIPLDVTKQSGPFVSVLGVSEMLEGKTRPNFFRGVATVVTKLLNIVSPDIAYFGQKDVQQCIVLETMVKELFMNVKLKIMPIIRNSKGLALSSRNKYLSSESLELATNLYRGLNQAEKAIKSAIEGGTTANRDDILAVIDGVWKPFIESKDFMIDYVSVADWRTLKEVDTIETNRRIVISCAVYVTDRVNANVVVRLIDNVIIDV